MKLLDKREIDRAKAAERKLDIDQGAKLAAKVDTLRELAAKEEGSLNTFVKQIREEALAQAAIFIQRRDTAIKEALEATIQRDALLRPIHDRSNEFSKREQELRKGQDAMDKESEALKKRSALLDKKENEVRIAKETNDENEEILNKMNIEISKLVKESQIDRIAAAKALTDVEVKVRQALAEVDKVVRDLKQREATYKADRESLANDIMKLNARERAIIDREETLARELERQINKL